MNYALSGHTVTAENLMFSKIHNTNRYVQEFDKQTENKVVL